MEAYALTVVSIPHFVIFLIVLVGMIGFSLARITKKSIPKPTSDIDPRLASLQDGICPDCSGNLWRMGPQGGIAQNILCAKCGAEFNIAPCDDAVLGPLVLAERLGNRPIQLWPVVTDGEHRI